MEYYRDIKLFVAPGVYPPAEDSMLLAGTIDPTGKVLEVGTGSGILAIHLAKKGHRVVATEINPKAIVSALNNARLNGVEDRIDIIRANLMDGIRGTFDTIVFNPPYLPSRPLGELKGIGELGAPGDLLIPDHEGASVGNLMEYTSPAVMPTSGTEVEDEEKGPKTDNDGNTEDPDDWLSRSWQGGKGGTELMERFMGELPNHLSKGGRGYVVVSSLTDFKLPEGSSMDFRVVAERSFPFERIFVLEVFRRPGEG